MSRLSTAFALARSVCVRMPRAGISRIVPPQPIVRPVLTARFRSTSTKPSAAPPVDTPPPAEESVGAAELFDQVEIDGAEWEGEEVEEGVFISAPAPPPQSSRPARPPKNTIKHLNRLLSRHQSPDIPEDELKEQFVRGRGPGGQAINKINSSVSLIHIPTGIRVQSQPTRSRAQNRVIARQILKERLDLMRVRGELPGQQEAAAEEEATEGVADGVAEGEAPMEEKELSRKEKLAAEARQWSKNELRWEKERRRKANRAKKVKRKKNREEDQATEEAEAEEESK